MNFLIFETNEQCGGFGDRIIGLMFVVSLAERLNRKLVIKWENPLINDLFKFDDYDFFKLKLEINKDNSEKINMIDCFPHPNYSIEAIKKYENFIQRIINFNFDKNFIFISINWDPNQIFFSNKDLYIKFLWKYFKIIFDKILILHQFINDIINSYNFQNNIIGFQIRNGDNIGLNKVSVDFYIKKFLNRIKPKKIYLSTDNDDITKYILKEYSNQNWITYNNDTKFAHFCYMKNSEYETKIKIKLILDYFLLSKCKEIYSHGWVSNLAITSACVGNIICYFSNNYDYLEYIKIYSKLNLFQKPMKFILYDDVYYSKTHHLHKYSNNYFITLNGDAIDEALKCNFNNIYVFEKNEDLFFYYSVKYQENKKIHLINLDVIGNLYSIIKNINESITFWLGTYYKQNKIVYSSILNELKEIKKHHINTHTILIDDRRFFGKEEYNFIEEEEIIKELYNINKDYEILYENGLIENDILVSY